MKMFLTILGGLLFGAGLVISGMTNPEKVIHFLDFSGDWDPSLSFVMGGALLIYSIGLIILKKRQGVGHGVALPDVSADPINPRLILGSALFGIGWGLGGFCPGPVLANLSTLRVEVLLFIPFMLIGMIVAQRIMNLDNA